MAPTFTVTLDIRQRSGYLSARCACRCCRGRRRNAASTTGSAAARSGGSVLEVGAAVDWAAGVASMSPSPVASQ